MGRELGLSFFVMYSMSKKNREISNKTKYNCRPIYFISFRIWCIWSNTHIPTLNTWSSTPCIPDMLLLILFDFHNRLNYLFRKWQLRLGKQNCHIGPYQENTVLSWWYLLNAWSNIQYNSAKNSRPTVFIIQNF